MQNPKWPTGSEKVSTTRVLGVLQLSLNKFFDPNTPSRRKGHDGKKNGGKIKMFIVATNVVASQLPERRLLVNGENSGSLVLLPVNRLNGDRLVWRPPMPKVQNLVFSDKLQ